MCVEGALDTVRQAPHSPTNSATHLSPKNPVFSTSATSPASNCVGTCDVRVSHVVKIATCIMPPCSFAAQTFLTTRSIERPLLPRQPPASQHASKLQIRVTAVRRLGFACARVGANPDALAWARLLPFSHARIRLARPPARTMLEATMSQPRLPAPVTTNGWPLSVRNTCSTSQRVLVALCVQGQATGHKVSGDCCKRKAALIAT